MAIVTVFKLTTMTPDKYEKVIAGLEGAGAGNPDGRLYHVASVAEGGTIIVTDVWCQVLQIGSSLRRPPETRGSGHIAQYAHNCVLKVEFGSALEQP